MKRHPPSSSTRVGAASWSASGLTSVFPEESALIAGPTVVTVTGVLTPVTASRMRDGMLELGTDTQECPTVDNRGP